MKRILLLGSNGQLGWELQRALAPLGSVFALSRHGSSALTDENTPEKSQHCGDLTRLVDLEATVRDVRPHVVVNAAAYTAVDRAETEPELAKAINSVAPGVLAKVAAELDALFVHFSTDYVFDGAATTPYREDDLTAPLNVYGKTKLEGERRVRGSGCRHVILRTSWVYAARGANFARTMLRLASQRDELNVVNDQIGAPTGADLLADTTAHVLRAVEGHAEICGTYHVAARGEVSWFDYARLVIERARSRGEPIRVAADALRPIPSIAFPTAAQRPLNSRLDCSKLEAIFGLRMPSWKFGVERMLQELDVE